MIVSRLPIPLGSLNRIVYLSQIRHHLSRLFWCPEPQETFKGGICTELSNGSVDVLEVFRALRRY